MTRSEYMAASREDGRAALRAYYGQFVTRAVRELVACRIGLDRIRASNDPHFNDIPLREWDALNPFVRDLCLSRAGDLDPQRVVSTNPKTGQRSIGWSLSDGVCIAKEAARQLREVVA